MNKKMIQKNKGFTVVEAIVAIFILTVSISALLSLTATSATSARYANNEITANYLLQEAIDSIRSSRDTIAFQMKDDSINGGWAKFLEKYGGNNSSKCFDLSKGCSIYMEYFDPTGGDNKEVVSYNLEYLKYDSSGTSQGFYLSPDVPAGNGIVESKFKRKVVMTSITDGVKVTATVYFQNGTVTKTQSLETILLNWQKD